MAGKVRCHLLIACTVLLCSMVFSAGSFVDPKDTALAKKAADKKAKLCKDVEPIKFTAEERSNLREDLEQASGIYEPMMAAMKKSSSSSDLTTNLQDEINVGALIPKAAPIVAFFLFTPIYILICCWTCCPCCRCCLCCRKQRNIPCMVKMIFVIFTGALIFGMVLCGLLSLRGFGASNEGFKSTSCSSAELVDSIMNGQGSSGQLNYFAGVINTLNGFDQLISTLKPGSNFLTTLKNQFKNTKDIEKAVTVASETLGLLITMMAAPENKVPNDGVCNQPSDIGCLHHTCSVCKQIEDGLKPVKTSLENSVGEALKAIRRQLEDELSDDRLKSLSGSFDTAAAPLTGLKGLMHSGLGLFVEQDTTEMASSQLDSNGVVASLFLIACGLLIATCGGMSLTSWMCLEKRKSASLRKVAHRCACCTWNSGCIYILIAFLIGGILMLVSVVFSSLCLVMEDVVLKPSLLSDMSRALDLNMATSELTMLEDILGQCFKPDNTENPLLLKIIKVTNSTGAEITMDQMIVGNTKDRINAEFDKIGTMGSGQTLAGNPDVVKLRNLMKDNDMSKMLIPKWVEDTTYTGKTAYQPMGVNLNLQPYLVSSADKSDFVLEVSGSNQSVKGLLPFVNEMDSQFPSVGVHRRRRGQWKDRVKTWSGESCGTDPACDAATKFMGLKDKLITKNLYRCTYFKYPTSSGKCEVTFDNSAGTFLQDCTAEQAGSSGAVTYSMQKYTVPCDLDTFTAHVKSFDTKLDTVFTALDKISDSTKTKLQNGMKNTVNTQILDKISSISQGLTCGVFGQKYQKFINGLCYKGAWGLRAMASSYAATAALTFVVVLLIYVVWRIALDNDEKLTEVQKYEGERLAQ